MVKLAEWVKTHRLITAGLAVAVAGVLAWVFWPSPKRSPGDTLPFREIAACAVVDDSDQARSAALLAALHDAATANRVKLQVSELPAGQTADESLAYVNGLARRQ